MGSWAMELCWLCLRCPESDAAPLSVRAPEGLKKERKKKKRETLPTSDFTEQGKFLILTESKPKSVLPRDQRKKQSSIDFFFLNCWIPFERKWVSFFKRETQEKWEFFQDGEFRSMVSLRARKPREGQQFQGVVDRWFDQAMRNWKRVRFPEELGGLLLSSDFQMASFSFKEGRAGWATQIKVGTTVSLQAPPPNAGPNYLALK